VHFLVRDPGARDISITCQARWCVNNVVFGNHEKLGIRFEKDDIVKCTLIKNKQELGTYAREHTSWPAVSDVDLSAFTERPCAPQCQTPENRQLELVRAKEPTKSGSNSLQSICLGTLLKLHDTRHQMHHLALTLTHNWPDPDPVCRLLSIFY